MVTKTITKDLNHTEIEDHLYQKWMENNLFKSDVSSKKNKFTIMMPPPNVTGTLHIGHALNMTIQDILARYWRMNGKDVLWQPGTDHAGIATQKIVEKNLKDNLNKTKKDLGKEKFLEEVWNWKEKSGSKIINQIKRLGASPDWSRSRFTLDQDMSNAVRYTFNKLYEKGLIYKDKRLINWDISLQTAVSDLEVEQKEQSGEFVFIKYFFENSKDYLVVATTRPETLFGDQCLAVNPSDKRYKKIIGKKVRIPLTEKLIPIIVDKHVDKLKGSGVLKITPAHDFNDYKIGLRNNLEMLIVFDKHGKLNKNVPAKYRGIDRLKARKEILNDLKDNNNLLKIEKIIHVIPYGDRSGSIIEPYLTDQWFMDVKPLAKKVVEKVENNETKFFPSNWLKTFYNWMDEIEPWCISRQIWWGHRIPVWYGPEGKIFLANNEKQAYDKATKYYGKKIKLKEETDVLDTWFSSALWPMSTLGWPNTDDDYFKHYYPTDVLITGFDIIFFWVARMMMQAEEFTKKMPFKEVYIHALVRDKNGQKMSKSKGNVIDPLKLIDSFGADALRFTLALVAAQGRDIKLSEESVRLNRNFITKIKNAYNFLEKNKCFNVSKKITSEFLLDENFWIMSLMNSYIKKIDKNIKSYRFNDAAKNIYKFTKNIFCDWYLEFIKISFHANSNNSHQEEIKYCANLVYINILKLAHPFIPFSTDDIFVNYLNSPKYLMITNWPTTNNLKKNNVRLNNIERLMSLITMLRNIKASLKIEPKNIINLYYESSKKQNRIFLKKFESYIYFLGRVNVIHDENIYIKQKNNNFLKFVDNDFIFFIEKTKIGGDSLLEKDIKLLSEQLKTLDKDITILNKKVGNEEFLNKAPTDVVDKFKNKIKDKVNLRNKIFNQIKSL